MTRFAATVGFAAAAGALLIPHIARADIVPAQWMMHDGWTGWGWPFGGVFGLVVLGLAVYGVMQLFRARESGVPADPATGAPALKTLDDRYAKSEIDRDEYLRRKRDILGKGEA